MASNWKTVKVFVTSYYKDFQKERDILFKEVLPDLKVWCETQKVQLLETDFRWGNRHGDNLQDLDSILQDIGKCYFHNDMPYFINISSTCLGWIPMWGDAQAHVVEDYMNRLGLSSKQMEVLYGAYREDNSNALFLKRDDTFLDELLLDEERKHFITKDMIPLRLRKASQATNKKYTAEQVVEYQYDNAGWDFCANTLHVDLSTNFSKQVLQFLKSRIGSETLVGDVPLNMYAQMKECQEAFMKCRSQKVRGRDDIIKQIEECIFAGDKDVPVLLLGGAGSGKSSIMCKSADRILMEAQQNLIPGGGKKGWRVFYHFVGAVPGSTELEAMLKRLLRELDIINESCMPKDLDSTAQLCCSVLSNPNTDPLIVLVDAINQFDEDHAAMVMSWVPRKLAPQVRCIFSMINDTPQHKTLMARESKPQELHLTPLDFDSRRKIVQESLGQYSRKLTPDQLNKLLSKQSSENPLWLSIACEEIRLVTDQELVDMKINDLADGLLNLLEEVLDRFEKENGGHLLVATLCLLEASASGLLETELLSILADEQALVPPSPYDEKDEKESSEKEKDSGSEKCQKSSCLPEDKWQNVYRALRPFLRPYGDSRQGRLDFYHRALSKAVRKKYFKKGDDNECSEESQDIFMFWHKKLADVFEQCNNVDRKVEEYLQHLCKIDDKERLALCLCEWAVFDKLYSDEFSSQLLSYWRKAGGSEEMIGHYKELLSDLENTAPRDDKLVGLRYEHIARIFLQSGRYSDSLELTKVALKMEEIDLGNRNERLVELYGLMSEIYDEKLKLNDFVSPTQLPDLRKTIAFGRKSIALRKTFEGDYHKFKLGMSLMKLAFSLESWEACGGDGELSGEDALREGNEYIDKAMKIFQELKDDGHYAEALMTKGVLAPRGSMEQLKYYNQAMELCMQVYGECHLLTSRLYINIGIVYEDNSDYIKAYDYFRKWAEVSEQVLGPEHPKTLRAKGVLKEPRYRLIALRLKEQNDTEGQNNEMDLDEDSINREVEELDEQADNNPDWANIVNWNENDGQGNNINLAELNEELQEVINQLLHDVLPPPNNNNNGNMNNANLPLPHDHLEDDEFDEDWEDLDIDDINDDEDEDEVDEEEEEEQLQHPNADNNQGGNNMNN